MGLTTWPQNALTASRVPQPANETRATSVGPQAILLGTAATWQQALVKRLTHSLELGLGSPYQLSSPLFSCQFTHTAASALS